jgi:hypothetical protein
MGQSIIKPQMLHKIYSNSLVVAYSGSVLLSLQ